MLEHIRQAEDALDHVNPYGHLSLEDLYALGGSLTALLGALESAVRGMQSGVKELRSQPVYDDTEPGAFLRSTAGEPVDPLLRLAKANLHLDAFRQHLAAAGASIRGYHSAIGHIGIRGER